MKKLLLSTSVLALTLSASAQLSGTTGYTMDNKSAASNCLINVGLPNNGGQLNGDQNTFTSLGKSLTVDGITLVSVATLPASDAKPAWYALPAVDGESCANLFGVAMGVDLTANSKVTVTATSSAAGAVLNFFLGGEGQWGPASSTYNTGSGKGITAAHTFASAGEETFTLDFATLDATEWNGWAGKNKIQSVGFSSGTDAVTFNVSKVLIGSTASGSNSVASVSGSDFSVYPNPASDVINVTLSSTASATVELSDLAGNVVSAQAVSGSAVVAINTADLAAGIYVVSVRSANGVSTQKVAVK